MKIIILLFFIVFIFSSCASLNLKVDLYKGEIENKADEELPYKIDAIIDYIKIYKDEKLLISDKLIPLYTNWVQAYSNRTIDSSEINRYENEKEIFKYDFNRRVNNIIAELDSLKSVLCFEDNSKYDNKTNQNPCDKNKFTYLVPIIVDKLTDTIKSSFFDTYFFYGWPQRVFEAQAYKDLISTPANQDRVDKAIQEMVKILNELRIVLPASSFWMEYNRPTSIQNQDYFYNLIDLLEDQTTAADVKDYADNILNNNRILNRSEAGSLAWKQILYHGDSTNLWKRVYGKTHWKATGNSEVVIVRDTPVDFRVKQGRNDPKNIIGAQLIVSRSVADVGLALAGINTQNLTPFTPEEEKNQIDSSVKSLVSANIKETIENLKSDLLLVSANGPWIEDTEKQVEYKIQVEQILNLNILRVERMLKMHK